MKAGLWPVGLVGGVLAALYVAVVMSEAGWNPTAMLAIGADSGPQRIYAEDVLGSAVATRPALGHDGRFFFILANDPFLLDPRSHAAFLDLPTYRSQRVLYPLLGSGAGLFTAPVTVWGLIVVNVVAAGIGSIASAALARLLGANRWVGLAFMINPGTIAEIDISGGGVLALALGITGMWLAIRKRNSWAIASFTGAVLARETMLLLVVGFVLWLWLVHQRRQWALLAVPAIVALVWRAYVGLRLSGLEPPDVTSEGLSRNFDLIPLRGAVEASRQWADDPTKLIWVLCLLGILVLYVRRAWSSRSAIAWSASPFVLLAIFLSEVVWLEPYDIARAIAPVFLAYPLLLFARRPLEIQYTP